MLAHIVAALAIAFMLLFGGAGAGEELMAMRSVTDDARTHVDMTNARVASGTGESVPLTGVAVERAIRDGVPFVGWQDTCYRIPVMVAGHPVDVASSGKFALAQPYAARPERDESLFLELLLRELTQE